MNDATRKATKLEALLDAAVDSIITIDRNAIIQSVNKSAEELFGYQVDEFVGRNVKFLMPEPWSSQHDTYLQQYQETGIKRIIGMGREVEGKRKDGSTFPMHLSVSEFWVDDEVFYSGIIHNMSARKDAERALERSQRLDAVGQLTGGIAHDFNNLLTVITGNLELLEMQIDAAGQLELLHEAQAAAELGANLTEQLLAFARRSVLQPEIVDINGLIRKLSTLLERTLGGHISFSMSLAADLWDSRVDPGQIESALLNLAVNSRDAMQSNGSLVIETSNIIIDQQFSADEVDVDPGEYIRISVSDTGTGMSEDVVQKVFEPFFTTKQAGHGTGLGLSMVYGFAKQSGGNVTVYSETGIGTTVSIYLPRHAGEAERSMLEADSTKTETQQGNGELLLVVEDDSRVRRLALERLKVLNYRTIAAKNGTEALELLDTTPGIDLVFTDLVMPGGVSGYDVADHVHQQYPHIGVLLTSGYAEDLIHSDKLSEHSIRLLRKPYRQAELAKLLREALETPR
tara:strand:- start:53668 stop:55209 length:1542 start_codon:yes stop_codon:yes gene_type:complete